ncbi:hypothetical protein CE91St38_00560 [Desulfovibrionaceae bacterium]|nr:hypothetical protein CE91St38_00560 [Desulfovibrionaceae bacterium]GKI10602.1 hypothetical protein CE91St39_00560 [Desulfovibrionaceae bacterium]
MAKDVCEILALENPRSSLALLDEDEKGVHIIDTPGGNPNLLIISESGLYATEWPKFCDSRQELEVDCPKLSSQKQAGSEEA